MALGSTIGTALGALGGGLSPIPGGTIAGGALGSLIGSQFDRPSANKGSLNKLKGLQQVPVLSPQQQQIQGQLGSLGLQGIQNPYQGFEGIENYAKNQFQSEILPSIAQRFAGTGSAISSPLYQSQLGKAGTDLAGQLALLRSQYGMQNRAQSLRELGLGMEPAFGYMPTQNSPLFQLLSLLAGGVGAGAGQLGTQYLGQKFLGGK